MKKKIVVLGLGLPHLDTGQLSYKNPVDLHSSVIHSADVLIGGKKQLELLPQFLGQKIAVTADISSLIATVKDNMSKGLYQVALATGDPLFFGLGTTLIQHLGASAVEIVPAISSFQAATTLLGLSMQEVLCVSLHGPRDWNNFSSALLSSRAIFLLTDDKNNPRKIAQYMYERGCTSYQMQILSGLHIKKEGQVSALEREELVIEQAMGWQLEDHVPLPRVIALLPDASMKEKKPWRMFGLADESFSRSDNVMTKRVARITGLGLLGIAPEHTVWDLGAGVGSVALEASRLAFNGRVFAIEQDPVRVQHIIENRKALRAANLHVIQAELAQNLTLDKKNLVCTCNKNMLPRPDRVFIGGGCGTSREHANTLLEKAYSALLEGGRLVVACTLLSTLEYGRDFFQKNGIGYEVVSVQSSASEKLGKDMYMKASNPIQFLVAYK